MLENPSNLEIVRVILGLGQVLRLTTVAEGVETREQLDALRQLGCPLAQGYCFGRPMDAQTTLRFLLERIPQAFS
jgi:EAL domain-containing protein (putative c-di-GMP-specific phosphodiesterase class I)